jgi:hypothetical protein
LRQRELALQDREVIAIASFSVGRREGMWHSSEPLAKDRIDLGGIQRVSDPLHAARRIARADAIVQRLKRDVAVRQLALQPLVPVQTQFGGVREIGTELEKQRAEVAVDNVDVVVIDHRRRADDPGVRLPGGVPPFLRAEDVGLLLRLPDKQHALLALEAGKVVLRDLVLPLPLLERHEVEALRRHKALDGGDELLAHRCEACLGILSPTETEGRVAQSAFRIPP